MPLPVLGVGRVVICCCPVHEVVDVFSLICTTLTPNGDSTTIDKLHTTQLAAAQKAAFTVLTPELP